MAVAPQRGLTAHYFLNFSVISDNATASHSGTWRKLVHMQQTPYTVLHLDVANGAVSAVDHEKETEVAKVADVLEVNSAPGQSMRLVLTLRGGQSPSYKFQARRLQDTTNHDAIIFQTTLLQLLHGGGPLGQLPHPRQLLKRGPIQKRGRSGAYRNRFVVLVPARMFIMQSRESKYPLNVLSLVSTKPDYDSNTRTISLTVADKTFVLRGLTDDDAADWLRKVEGSIGLRYNPYKFSQQAVAAAAGQQLPTTQGAVPAARPTTQQAARHVMPLPLPRQDPANNGRPTDQTLEITAADDEEAAAYDDGTGPPGNQQDADHGASMADWREVAAAACSSGDDASRPTANGYRDSSGTADFQDSREYAASADGSLSGYDQPSDWNPLATMTETLGASAPAIRGPAGDAETWNNTAAEEGDAAAQPSPAASGDEPRPPLQEHIGAVLTRVRSLMSGVDSLKAQQAALAAAANTGGGGGPQTGLIAAGRQHESEAAAARAFLQHWRDPQQQLQHGSGGMPAGFTGKQAVRVQALLQELASLSAPAGAREVAADDGTADHTIGQQLNIDLGNGVDLRLLPNMRIVIEMDGGAGGSAASSLQQPLMTAKACAQIAEASIAAARAAEAAVNSGLL